MSFGESIGGFKYVRPDSWDSGFQNAPDSAPNELAILENSLKHGPLRAVTALTNSKTQGVLVQISKVLDDLLRPNPQNIMIEGSKSAELIKEFHGALTRMEIGAESPVSSWPKQKLSPKEEDIIRNPSNYEITETWKNLRTKLEELFIANRDIGESIKRGWRDLVANQPLKTEIKNRIKDELFEPLKDYIANEPTITEEKRQELTGSLEKIEQNHLATKGGRGS